MHFVDLMLYWCCIDEFVFHLCGFINLFSFMISCFVDFILHLHCLVPAMLCTIFWYCFFHFVSFVLICLLFLCFLCAVLSILCFSDCALLILRFTGTVLLRLYFIGDALFC